MALALQAPPSTGRCRLTRAKCARSFNHIPTAALSNSTFI
jgi:hypothetical protein